MFDLSDIETVLPEVLAVEMDTALDVSFGLLTFAEDDVKIAFTLFLNSELKQQVIIKLEGVNTMYDILEAVDIDRMSLLLIVSTSNIRYRKSNDIENIVNNPCNKERDVIAMVEFVN